MTVVTMPQIIPGTPEDSSILNTQFAALATVLNGNVDSANIAASGISDAKLRSPQNEGALRIFEASGSDSSGTLLPRYLTDGGAMSFQIPDQTTAMLVMDPTSFGIVNKTPHFRASGTLMCNPAGCAASQLSLVRAQGSSGAAGAINIGVDTGNKLPCTPFPAMGAAGSGMTRYNVQSPWLPRTDLVFSSGLRWFFEWTPTATPVAGQAVMVEAWLEVIFP